MQFFIIRLMDITLSLAGIVVSSPIMIVVFFGILFFSKSPLFVQTRIGRNQHAFKMIKFRTMHLETESVGTHLVDASRITPIGSILRKTKLDELPQLFNVLVGQMSLVGPRPCLASQIELVHERYNRGVFDIRPGITGLAQICEVDMSTPRKLARYDQLLLKNMSIKFYIQLLLATGLGKGRGDRIKTT